MNIGEAIAFHQRIKHNGLTPTLCHACPETLGRLWGWSQTPNLVGCSNSVTFGNSKRRKFERHLLEKALATRCFQNTFFLRCFQLLCFWYALNLDDLYKVWTGKTCTDVFPHTDKSMLYLTKAELEIPCLHILVKIIRWEHGVQRHVIMDTSEDAWYHNPATHAGNLQKTLDDCRVPPIASEFPSPCKSPVDRSIKWETKLLGNRTAGGFSLRVSVMRSWQSFVQITWFMWELWSFNNIYQISIIRSYAYAAYN